MRTKEEIFEDAAEGAPNESLLLEALVDIRDLLEKMNEPVNIGTSNLFPDFDPGLIEQFNKKGNDFKDNPDEK